MSQHPRRRMLYGRLAEAVICGLLGITMLGLPLGLCGGGLLESVRAAGPTMPASEWADLSGRFAIAISGLMLVAVAIASFSFFIQIQNDGLFTIEESAWRRVSWRACECFYSAAVVSFVPSVCFLLVATVALGASDGGGLRVAWGRTIPSSWLQATAGSTVAAVALCILGMGGRFYSCVSIDRASREVLLRRRRWPFRARITQCGTAQELLVLSQAQARWRDFFNPDVAGWLVLRTPRELIPLTALFSFGEISAFQEVAELWNAKLKLGKSLADS
jgi:hypothetical protein